MGNQHSSTSEEGANTSDNIENSQRVIVSELEGEDAWYLTGASSEQPSLTSKQDDEDHEEEYGDQGMHLRNVGFSSDLVFLY